MGHLQDSVCSRLWRTASSGSAVVAICRRAMILPGQIGRGSRLLKVLAVEDYLDEDRGPLVAMVKGSRWTEKLLRIYRYFTQAVLSLSRRDVQAFRLSRLNMLFSGADGFMSRLPATMFFILFLAVFFLIMLVLSITCPDAYWIAPWSAGPVIGVLAALLIARNSGNGQGRGLLGKSALGTKWLLRSSGLLLRRIRHRLSVFLHGRGKTPVEGGPEI